MPDARTDVPALVAEVERLAARLAAAEKMALVLDEIADGCRCTHPDQWAVGQCSCQTAIASAALDAWQEAPE